MNIIPVFTCWNQSPPALRVAPNKMCPLKTLKQTIFIAILILLFDTLIMAFLLELDYHLEFLAKEIESMGNHDLKNDMESPWLVLVLQPVWPHEYCNHILEQCELENQEVNDDFTQRYEQFVHHCEFDQMKTVTFSSVYSKESCEECCYSKW